MLEKLERSVYGISKKEIADNSKKTRFKSSPKEVFELDEAHKASPADEIK